MPERVGAFTARLKLLSAAALLAGVFAMTQYDRVSLAAPGPDGKGIFAAKCAACHQANGRGAGPFPALAGNPHVTAANTQDLIATVLNGKTGPVSVLGKSYSGAMPAWAGQFSNAEIAAVLTYIRAAWANKAPMVSEDQVAAANVPTMLSGAANYGARCVTCHRSDGQGTASIIPPLAGNPHVAAADTRELIATIVNGKVGPVTVNGITYNSRMPGWKGHLSNADIAAVATYIRLAWMNNASGVTEQQSAAAGPNVSSAVGAAIYATKCVLCHRANGRGQPDVPPLAGNSHVIANDPTEIIGTIERGGTAMPSWRGQLSDTDIAAVATYIRSAWGNKARPVSEADVVSFGIGIK